MPSTSFNDLLTCFSPSLELYAASLGDGRVKIWDTLKGHLQVEFTDIAPASSDILQPKPANGHLSVDYTCMDWVQLKRKKKNRPGSYMLVLGTGGGEVLALDVSGGQLKWKVSDCHPGGVSAVSFSGNSSCIFTAGVDGMVCQMDCSTGNVLGKFRASTKAISSLSTSSDGKMLVTASGLLKVSNCSDYRKVQKFSGHPASVRSMTFSEDGKYILSSAVGEKFLTIWKINHTKNRSACCVLPVEQPIICLDCKGFDDDNGRVAGLYVLAVSEAGLCYFWNGTNVQSLHERKPTTISLSVSSSVLKSNGSGPVIYSAKFQGIAKSASADVLVAHGSIVKPHFEKVNVHYGMDVTINWSQHAALLPTIQLYRNEKEHAIRKKVTRLDRANAEDAVIPFPKINEYLDKKRKHSEPHFKPDPDVEMEDAVVGKRKVLDREVLQEEIEEETGLCLEDMLKSAGILCSKDKTNAQGLAKVPSSVTINAATLKDVCLLVAANRPTKKISDSTLIMFNGDAFKFLEVLIFMWKSRLVGEQSVLPWISHVVVNYGHSIMSHESHEKIIEESHKMTMIKCSAFEPLLHLSGCLQLVTAQIDKSVCDVMHVLPTEHPVDESDEDDEVDEVVYGEDTSQSSDNFDG